MCQLLVQRASVAKCGPTDIFRAHFHCRAKITHRFICIKFSFDRSPNWFVSPFALKVIFFDLVSKKKESLYTSQSRRSMSSSSFSSSSFVNGCALDTFTYCGGALIRHPHNSEGNVPLAIVLGASRGIGASVAEQLAAAGYDVALLARDTKRLESQALRISAAFPSRFIHTLGADLLVPQACVDCIPRSLQALARPYTSRSDSTPIPADQCRLHCIVY